MPAWFKKIHPQKILDEVNLVIDEWLKTSSCLTMRTNDPGGGLMMHDDAGTRRICDQTLQCIDACLHPNPKRANFTAPAGPPGTVEMLYDILAATRPEMGPVTIERMRRQLHEYVEGVARQQSVRHDDRLPDPWYHLKLRCDDIGAMERVVLDCAKLCVLVNEILSLKKEFREGQLENLCLLSGNAEGISIHAAVAKVKQLIQSHYRSCDAAVGRLPWTADEQVNENMRRYVQCCQRIATGTAQWSYMCTRYFQRAQ
ncbi:uncharacterized protein PG986_004775 [Apiospora aurea]|uniref:Uncharacterized protein n=1 Tax=Apiospora aurea TaxID=335848 RepID=A0ABR1QNY3_9PEZI